MCISGIASQPGSSRPSPAVQRVHCGATSSNGSRLLRLERALAFLLLIITLALPVLVQAAQDDSKALKERATAYWEARIKGDWATEYDFLSEAKRESTTKEEYVTATKDYGPFRYLSYKLGTVETAEDTGWVKVSYASEPVLFPGIPPAHEDRWELWEKIDGKWFPVEPAQLENLPRLPPSLRPLKEEAAVTARANEFWKAREKEDYATVYQLCPPSFRAKVSAKEFLGKKARNTYVAHRILWTEVKGDHAKLRVSVDYRPNDPTVTKLSPMEETIFQQWIKVDNQWYLDITDE